MSARSSASFSRSFLKTFVYSILLFAISTSLTWAQERQTSPAAPTQQQSVSGHPASSQQASESSPKKDVPGTGITVQDQQSTGGEPNSSQEQQPQQPAGPLTKQQAKDLFRSVDTILHFASHDTGLPEKHSVKRRLITRQSVENYVEKRIREDKDTQRLQRSEAVLKKFGLLPPDYDLHAEFLRLLGEQVAAFYDPRTKTVSMLDWVPPDQQKPVLAHELTHALQDQKVGLEKWQLAGAKDDSPLPDNQEEVVEEAQAARQAVTEGQAMIVFLDYSLAPLGKDVLSAPEVVDAMRAEMGASQDSPLFSAAPIFLRESLLMPYTFGTDFERYVLEHKGKDAAFAGVLDSPPADTRQIMEPETYLAHQVAEPLKIPDLDQLAGPKYERYDFGGMGEFDVYLLVKQYAPDQDPKNIYSHWRGGYYYAAHGKGAPKDQVSLLYMSRWDSPVAAAQFAKVYEGYVPKRYLRWFKNGSAPAAAVGGRPNISIWSEGPESEQVKVEQSGNDLLVLEGFDADAAEHMTEALLRPGSPESTNRPTSPKTPPLQ